jgi:hypothetical protein
MTPRVKARSVLATCGPPQRMYSATPRSIITSGKMSMISVARILLAA